MDRRSGARLAIPASCYHLPARGGYHPSARGRVLLDGLAERLRAAEDQLLAGLDGDADRQAFRALLERIAVHAATALDSAALDPAAPDASCTAASDALRAARAQGRAVDGN